MVNVPALQFPDLSVPFNLAQSYGAGLRDRNAFAEQQQRQQMNAFALQDAQQKQQDRNALSAAGPQITSNDPAQREQGYRRLSDQPELVMRLRKEASDQDKDAFAQAKERIAASADAAGRAAVGLGSLSDDQLAEHWPAAVAALEAKVGHPAPQWRQAQNPKQMRQVLEGSIADAQTVQQALAQQNTERTASETALRDKNTAAYQQGRLKAEQAKAANPQGTWQVLTDPKTQQQYRYNATTGTATTLDNKPYTPQGAGKISGGGLRSAPTVAVQKFMEENPNATADDIGKFMSDLGARQGAAKSWSTGANGQTMVALDTAVNHLDTIQELASALDNGNVQLFNSLKNRFKEEFGSDLPTNLKAAAPIVAGELAKVVAGVRGSTQGERNELEKTYSLAASQRQLSGALGAQRSLIAGKLSELKRNFKRTTKGSDSDFEELLSPVAKRELGSLPSGDTQSAGKAPAVGAIEDGHRFKGGDPSKQENWERVQ